jgi:HK97 family phage major capsid protein
MSDARKLHEKRANLLTEAQSIVTDLAEKGEALEGESQARFEKLTSEAATVAAAIRSEKEASEARSAADAVRAEYATAIAPKVEKTEGSNDELRALARNGGVQLFEYRDVSRSTGLGNPVTIADRVNVVAAQFNPFIDPAIVTVVRASTGNNIQFHESRLLERLDQLLRLARLASRTERSAPCPSLQSSTRRSFR